VLSIVDGSIRKVTIPTQFVADKEMTTNMKCALISLYKDCLFVQCINPLLVIYSYAQKHTLEALEHISDIGYWILGESIDFERVFSLKSRYDD